MSLHLIIFFYFVHIVCFFNTFHHILCYCTFSNVHILTCTETEQTLELLSIMTIHGYLYLNYFGLSFFSSNLLQGLYFSTSCLYWARHALLLSALIVFALLFILAVCHNSVEFHSSRGHLHTLHKLSNKSLL